MMNSGHYFRFTFALGVVFGLIVGHVYLVWENRYHFSQFMVNSIERDLILPKNETWNTKLADDIAIGVRVLCWVPIAPDKVSQVITIRKTWGKRCDILLFMSTKEDKSIAMVKLPCMEGRDYLWSKTKEALKYIHKRHLYRADWFLKADDDSFIILENLRHFLSDKNSSDPICYGSRFSREIKLPNLPYGYIYGGSGYVMSRAALIKVVEEGFTQWEPRNAQPKGNEDVEISRTMVAVNVTLGDSRDEIGRETFLPGLLAEHLQRDLSPSVMWFWNKLLYHPRRGPNCCSDHSISFHRVEGVAITFYDYVIYKFRAFGLYTNIM